MALFFKKISVILAIAFISATLLSGCSSMSNSSLNSQTPYVSSSIETPNPVPTPSNTNTQNSQTSTVPKEWNDNGIFSDYYDKAYKKLSTMSLKEKVGQIFLLRCPTKGAVDTIQQYYLGGFVLFGRDFESKTVSQVVSTIASYQKASLIPMIMSVDEEGGSIVRISSNPSLANKKFQSPQELYKNGGLSAVYNDTVNKASLLKKLGLNLNLAPIADVSQNKTDFIYNRTIGKSASITAQYVTKVVQAMQSTGLSSTLKHFPGFGNNVNTDLKVAIDNRSTSTLENNDFLPFKAGISAGAETVMVSNVIVKCMDASMPASLSPKVHNVLRNELHFTGVIMTDDLAANAIKKYTDNTDPAVKALLAGNDMLMVDDIEPSYGNVLSAIDSGVISEETIDRAVFRILAWKYAKGILK